MNRHFGYYALCAAAMLLLPAAVSAGQPANVPEQAPAGQYAESYRVMDSHTGEIREVPVRDYLMVPHSLDGLDFEYGQTTYGFRLYGDIAVDGRGYITQYTETYTP